MMFVQSRNEGERQELKRLARREVGRVSERMLLGGQCPMHTGVPSTAVRLGCNVGYSRYLCHEFWAIFSLSWAQFSITWASYIS